MRVPRPPRMSASRSVLCIPVSRVACLSARMLNARTLFGSISSARSQRSNAASRLLTTWPISQKDSLAMQGQLFGARIGRCVREMRAASTAPNSICSARARRVTISSCICKQVGPISIEPVGPEMCTRLNVNELCADSHSAAAMLLAPFDST